MILISKRAMTCRPDSLELDEGSWSSGKILAHINSTTPVFNEIIGVVEKEFVGRLWVVEAHFFLVTLGVKGGSEGFFLQVGQKGRRSELSSFPFDLAGRVFLDSLLDRREYARVFTQVCAHLPFYDLLARLEKNSLERFALSDPFAPAARTVNFSALGPDTFAVGVRVKPAERSGSRGSGGLALRLAQGRPTIHFVCDDECLPAFELALRLLRPRFPSLRYACKSVAVDYAGLPDLCEFLGLFLSLYAAYLALLECFRAVG